MSRDGRDLAVSNASPQAIAALDFLREQWLAYGNRLAEFLPAVERDPDCPMIVMMAALLHLSMENRQGYSDAEPFLARARALAERMNERERLWLAILDAQHRDDLSTVTAAHEALAERFPRDVLGVKLGQKHYFYLGDFDAMLRLADRTMAANADVPFRHGMRAFALEQCHRLEEAEEEGRRGAALVSDPWAHHAVAHVMETQGRVEEGIAWMQGHARAWDQCNSFLYTHNWWHLALFLIDADRTAEALALFDRRVWGVWKEFSQDQVNAVALLARLELRGVDVGERWRDVAPYLLPRLHEHVSPFLDLHYVLGLARAGERAAVTEMLASLEAQAQSAPDFVRRAWRDAAVPAAHGIAAHAAGDWAEAVNGLAAALPHLQAIGGSHAQRDLFEQLHLDALIRAGWNDKALARLRQRDLARPAIPALKRSLADIHARLGQAEAAAHYAATAQSLARNGSAAAQ
ncbi:MAG: tetratricopeptide repeat protein [Reyranellaceae bacterium]